MYAWKRELGLGTPFVRVRLKREKEGGRRRPTKTCRRAHNTSRGAFTQHDTILIVLII